MLEIVNRSEAFDSLHSDYNCGDEKTFNDLFDDAKNFAGSIFDGIKSVFNKAVGDSNDGYNPYQDNDNPVSETALGKVLDQDT